MYKKTKPLLCPDYFGYVLYLFDSCSLTLFHRTWNSNIFHGAFLTNLQNLSPENIFVQRKGTQNTGSTVSLKYDLGAEEAEILEISHFQLKLAFKSITINTSLENDSTECTDDFCLDQGGAQRWSIFWSAKLAFFTLWIYQNASRKLWCLKGLKMHKSALRGLISEQLLSFELALPSPS